MSVFRKKAYLMEAQTTAAPVAPRTRRHVNTAHRCTFSLLFKGVKATTLVLRPNWLHTSPLGPCGPRGATGAPGGAHTGASGPLQRSP
eukprot:5321558-Prymnesium_polylepis.2